ncbi:phytanoyl-CoA dioxygenase family protein [Lampropedia puyangensis]|uniref:Phytanoyl-CoA dioxygenase family protein n=1 Tax=Lampropedia puyangensis TaxID=1330072 RepID=A0A4S8FFA9_9BURK|nr:phytanoyl-CoA dioxygenase family protein [Lampropedia puyangensis]THU04552.1 phytanoyl-CoA dioxygenase family protein [Lampropedia puyangensis]
MTSMSHAANGFQTNGYHIQEAVLCGKAIAALQPDLANTPTEGAGTRNLLQEVWCQQLAQDLMSSPEMAALMPQGYMAIQCTYFEKSPERNWLVALHQDLSIPIRKWVKHPQLHSWSRKENSLFLQPPRSILEQLIAVRIHIDTCGLNDGPLKVVPGTHLQGILTEEQAIALRTRTGEVVCVTNPGDALVMKPLLLHASSKAKGHSRRRVLHFLYGPSQLPWGLEWPLVSSLL